MSDVVTVMRTEAARLLAESERLTQKADVFEMLWVLRASTTSNMSGAVPFILDTFPSITRQTASELLGEWMRTPRYTETPDTPESPAHSTSTG